MAQDSQSAPSEGFVIVDPFEDGSYSRSRSPQRNDDNLSSAQVAGASSDRNDVNVSSYSNAGYNDPRGLVHQPMSTRYTTETGGTDNTQIKFDTIAALDQGLTGVSATPGMYFGHVSDNPLTLSNMERLQQHLYPGNIHTWIDNAGLGRRLNRHLTSKRGPKSASSSRSKLSTISSADQDWDFVPQPYAMDNEVAFAGEWSGEQLDQLHRAVGYEKSKGE